MAFTQLALQTISRTGIVPSFTAAPAGGSALDNTTGRVFLYVKNGGASPITVTIGSAKTIDGRTLAAPTVTVANAAEKIIGPFPKSLYNEVEPDTGLTEAVKIAYSAVTTVTVAALYLPAASY